MLALVPLHPVPLKGGGLGEGVAGGENRESSSPPPRPSVIAGLI